MMHIGPLTTHRELMESDLVRRHAPLLAGAAGSIGSPQIRNRGTIGGNIMNAAACADTVPPLIALGAAVSLMSTEGERTCSLDEFFLQPYVTIARPGELLTRISFPVLTPMTHGAFIKLGRRNALAIARLSVAAIMTRDISGVTVDARIVPGAVFPSWKRVKEAEQVLVGRNPTPGLFAEAGRKVSEAMIAVTGRRWSTEYKEPVIAVLVQRALARCAAAEPVIGPDPFSGEAPARPESAGPGDLQPRS
jgi:carbon-monoxide dehydrogenase medium subunit/xanthine dehydrogenase FAD-binding subunit